MTDEPEKPPDKPTEVESPKTRVEPEPAPKRRTPEPAITKTRVEPEPVSKPKTRVEPEPATKPTRFEPAKPKTRVESADKADAEPDANKLEPKPDGPETVRLTASDLPDEPILPLTADLREAVGAPKRRYEDDEEHEDDDGEPKPRNRRTVVVAAISIMAGLAAVALIFLGRANAQRYLIVCDAAHVTAEQGRGFPPWGSHPLSGPEWKVIALPPNAECKPRETEDVDELGKWYLDVLVERATVTLTSRTLLEPVPANATSPLDTVADELNQALLLARSPDRRDQRKEVERLLGDVDYWRASLRLRDASAVLQEAAKQFDTAAAQRPRHVSDAAAWATFLRKLSDELHAGPNAAPTAQFPAAGSAAPTVTAPPGVALPVEAGSAAGSAEQQPPAPDAGVPSGGVLL